MVYIRLSRFKVLKLFCIFTGLLHKHVYLYIYVLLKNKCDPTMTSFGLILSKRLSVLILNILFLFLIINNNNQAIQQIYLILLHTIRFKTRKFCHSKQSIYYYIIQNKNYLYVTLYNSR